MPPPKVERYSGAALLLQLTAAERDGAAEAGAATQRMLGDPQRLMETIAAGQVTPKATGVPTGAP